MKRLMLALLALPLIVAGCDGGGDDTPPTAVLSGTWGGTSDDNPGGLMPIVVTFDAAGQVTSVVLGGTDMGSGTVTLEPSSSKLFSVVMSDGTEVGFGTDSGFNHAAWVDENFSFGVMEKGAAPPTGAGGVFALADLDGTWSGLLVQIDAFFDVVGTGTSTVTINGTTGTFSGSDSTGVTFTDGVSPLSLTDGAWGKFDGTYSDSVPSTGSVTAILTPDKRFAGSYSCENPGGVVFGNCDFNAWRKQ